MRLDQSLSALLLAAMLGSAMTACQRQPTPPPLSEAGWPPGERSVVRPGPSAVQPNQPRPGAGEAVEPPPARGLRPAGIEI